MAPAAPTLRLLVLEVVETAPATGEQVLATLRRRGVRTLLYSVKPRLSELKRAGLIADTGQRGESESGARRSVIWRATTADERRQVLEDERAKVKLYSAAAPGQSGGAPEGAEG